MEKAEVLRWHFEAVHRRRRKTPIIRGLRSAPVEEVDVLLALEALDDGRSPDQTVYNQPF